MIKVSDFGLSESMDGNKVYFRQDQEKSIKLPFKWLAPESIEEGVFSQKTDVVCKFMNSTDTEISSLRMYSYPEIYSFIIFSFTQWSYGVTCWEIFSSGETPYPNIHPLEVAPRLKKGYRMEKPANAACSDEM